MEFKVEKWRPFGGELLGQAGRNLQAGLKPAFHRLMAETAESLLPPPFSQAAFSQALFPTSDQHQTPSAGDKDTGEGNGEKTSLKRNNFHNGESGEK